MSNLDIIPESSAHADAVFEINRLAFEQDNEAQLVERLRPLGEAYLSLVAVEDGAIVGHILFTPVTVAEAPGLNAWGLGPMSVLPDRQRMGIGGRLIVAGIAACASRGIEAVFVLGHAEYYPKFGFTPAADKGFHYESPEFDPHFFVRELVAGTLDGKHGWVKYDPAFSAL